MNIIEDYKKYKNSKIPKKERKPIIQKLTLFKRYYSKLPSLLQQVSVLEKQLNKEE